MNKMSKILIVGPSWVGDMVMAQPLFHLLKQQNPNLLIDVLAPAWSRPVLSRIPEINRTLALPFRHRELRLWERFQLAKQLKHQGYTQAIILPRSYKAALIPFYARISKRTGWLGEHRWILINDMRHLDKKQFPLMVERFITLGFEKNTALPDPLPRPTLQISQESIAKTAKKFQLTRENAPTLILCPGAEFGPAKRWPTAYFAEVAKEKLAEDWQVWLIGSSTDKPAAEEIQKATNNGCLDFMGETTLLEAIDFLSIADIIVCNDSGLMHIAAALNKPLVALFGSSDPSYTPPLTNNVKILSRELDCSPCFKRTCPFNHFKCLRDIEPQSVITAIDQLQMMTA